jgi:hypothetical protein
MTPNTLTKTAFLNIKKEAKKIKKNSNIKYTEALEIASKHAGFSSYWEAEKCFSESSQNSRPTPDEKTSKLTGALDLLDQILNHPVPNPHHDELKIENIKAIHSDIFNNGIHELTRQFDDLFFTLGYSFDKEAFKTKGYQLLAENDAGNKLTGLFLLALCHFFRSAQSCLSDQRNSHPNFDDYFTDWLRSLSLQENATAIVSVLCTIFPKREIPVMKNGSTTWVY